MRMLCWPLRFPRSASKRLPGGIERSLRQPAASRMASLRMATRAKPPKRLTCLPSNRARVSRQRNDLITFSSYPCLTCLCQALAFFMPPTPGTGTGYDFDLVNEIPETMRIILSGGLTPENVVQAVRTVVPWGVDVSSGVEKSPGYKDPIKMKHFITNARSVQTDELLEERSANGLKNSEPYNWQDEAR